VSIDSPAENWMPSRLASSPLMNSSARSRSASWPSLTAGSVPGVSSPISPYRLSWPNGSQAPRGHTLPPRPVTTWEHDGVALVNVDARAPVAFLQALGSAALLTARTRRVPCGR
jgi:hypothetical protein